MNRGSAEILPFVPPRAEQDPAYAGAPALKTLLNRAFGGLIPLQRRPTCLDFATIMLLISCSPVTMGKATNFVLNCHSRRK